MMHRFCSPLLACLLVPAFLGSGCSTEEKLVDHSMRGESCVLIKENPAFLCYAPINQGVEVRNNYVKEAATIVYTEGKDYLMDYEQGTLKRTPGSRIPDYSTHILFGKDTFNHANYGSDSGCSNKKYFVYVDYKPKKMAALAAKNDQGSALRKFAEKLKSGQDVNIVWYGNSITNGGEASKPELAFRNRYIAFLKQQYPEALITSVNSCIPGYGSKEALAWFPDQFAALHPDMVFLGFGMNDHNLIGCEPEAFESNMEALVKEIKAKFNADVALFSAFPPNDHWYQSTHRMGLFAAATKKVAERTNSAYINVYETWMKVLERKNQPSLISNNINHPNDFGHWIYEQAFEAMQF